MKILFDVTETMNHKSVSGIQRVVRSVAAELYERQSEFNCEVQLVRTTRSGLVSVRFDDFAGHSENDLSANAISRSLAGKFIRIGQNLKARARPGSGLNKFAYSRFGLFVGLALYRWRNWSDWRLNFQKNLISPTNNQCVFLSLDSFWGRDAKSLVALRRYKSRGTAVIFMVHDLIPITHKDFVSSSFNKVFEKNLEIVAATSNCILFPSQASRNDYLKHRPLNQELKLCTIALGSDFTPESNLLSQLAPKKPKSLVAVGTVDKRKNYELLAKWFREIGFREYSLTIVGRSNGSCLELEEQLEILNSKHPSFTWLSNASDEILFKVLSEAEIGVSASFAEGFGLPTIEMSRMGCKLLLSDLPVNREVAPKGAVYFDPTSVSSFQEGLKKLDGVEFTVSTYRSWSSFTSDLLKIIR